MALLILRMIFGIFNGSVLVVQEVQDKAFEQFRPKEDEFLVGNKRNQVGTNLK